MLLDSSLLSDRSLAAARRNGELINLERFDAVLTRAFRATRLTPGLRGTANRPSPRPRKKARLKPCPFHPIWWALKGSNLRPLPCRGSALPLS